MPKAPPVIEPLQKELRTLLGDAELRLGKLSDNTIHYSFLQISAPNFLIPYRDDSGYNISLLPITVSHGIIYFLSLDIEIPDRRPTHVSIAFYNRDKEKLFKGEWSANKSTIEHAQPHWHIHYTKPTLDSEKWNQEDRAFLKEDYIQVPNKDKFSNIHFAMSALWHKKGDHVHSFPPSTDKELIDWIIGVIDYSIQQLTYLHDKRQVI